MYPMKSTSLSSKLNNMTYPYRTFSDDNPQVGT